MPIARRPTPLINSTLPVRVVSRQTAARLLAMPAASPSVNLRREKISAAAGSETDGVSLVLPVPPSVNHQYATVRGRRLLSAAGRTYKAQVGNLVMLALSKSSTARPYWLGFNRQRWFFRYGSTLLPRCGATSTGG